VSLEGGAAWTSPRLDLANPLSRQVEVLSYLFQRAAARPGPSRSAASISRARARRGGARSRLISSGSSAVAANLEGRLGRAVLDDVAELGIAILPQRFRQSATSGSARNLSASISMSSGMLGIHLRTEARSMCGRPNLSSRRACAFCTRARVSRRAQAAGCPPRCWRSRG